MIVFAISSTSINLPLVFTLKVFVPAVSLPAGILTA